MMIYKVSKRCHNKIATFYNNVARKYKNTYSKELMHKNIDEAINGMYKIENGLQRRTPTISRWEGYFMANTDKWYYAYTIDNEIITIVDVCHAQNMKESSIHKPKILLKESQLRRIIRESIKKVLALDGWDPSYYGDGWDKLPKSQQGAIRKSYAKYVKLCNHKPSMADYGNYCLGIDVACGERDIKSPYPDY